MTSLIFRKTLNGRLEPTDDTGRTALTRFKSGDLVRLELRKPRKVEHHRKFFAMLNIVFQNQEHYQSVDDLLDVCKLSIGHCRTIRTKHGDVKVPASISFAAMDQIEFSRFYDSACDWILKDVIPGLRRHVLDAEVEAELREIAA